MNSDAFPQPRISLESETLVVTGKSEYHERWGVRRYDLTNLLDDLDNCTESGRGFAIWGSLFGGGAIAAALSWIGAIATHGTPIWLEVVLGFGAMTCLVLGVALFVLDKKFATKAGTDLSFVKRRVRTLISMFDQQNSTQVADAASMTRPQQLPGSATSNRGAGSPNS